MYKVRDAAALLNVETVEIHKKLISLKADLHGHVSKDNGITYLDDEGIQIIARSFLEEDKELIKEINPAFAKPQVESESFKSVNNGEAEPSEVKHDIIESTEGGEKDLPASKSSVNAIKAEINSLDSEIYRLFQMIHDYSEDLMRKNMEIKKLKNGAKHV